MNNILKYNEVGTMDVKEVKPSAAAQETKGDFEYTKPVKSEKVQITIYVDKDVQKALKAFKTKNGKGANSDLVNGFLRQFFNL